MLWDAPLELGGGEAGVLIPELAVLIPEFAVPCPVATLEVVPDAGVVVAAVVLVV